MTTTPTLERQLYNCPPWCTWDHSKTLAADGPHDCTRILTSGRVEVAVHQSRGLGNYVSVCDLPDFDVPFEAASATVLDAIAAEFTEAATKLREVLGVPVRNSEVPVVTITREELVAIMSALTDDGDDLAARLAGASRIEVVRD